MSEVFDLNDYVRRLTSHLPDTVADIDNGADPGDVARSWQRIDPGPILAGTYQPPQPTVGRRDDGKGLFYPGKLHSVAAEPEAGKTWLMLVVASSELAKGKRVLYIDFEDSPESIIMRLAALGTPHQAIIERFDYVRPETGFSEAAREQLAQLITPDTSLAVLDGVTEAMSLLDLKPKDDVDVASFWRRLPRWISDQGPAVVLLDHVVKDKETRGRWATGSQHKLAGLNGAAYQLELVKPFGIGMTGKSRLIVVKDRPGQVRPHGVNTSGDRCWWADLVLESCPDGSVMASLAPPVEHDGPFRPTAIMRKVSDALAGAPAPLSVREIQDRVGGRQEVVRAAIARLVDEGYVAVEDGPRGARLHRLVKPFEDS